MLNKIRRLYFESLRILGWKIQASCFYTDHHFLNLGKQYDHILTLSDTIPYVFTITTISGVRIILWACVVMRQNNQCFLYIFFSNTELQLEYLEENISKLNNVNFGVAFQNVWKNFKFTVMNYSPKSFIKI